jgi:hypothetical protein
MAEVWDDPSQEVELLLRMLLLPVSKLIDRGIPDQSGTAGFEDAGRQMSAPQSLRVTVQRV